MFRSLFLVCFNFTGCNVLIIQYPPAVKFMVLLRYKNLNLVHVYEQSVEISGDACLSHSSHIVFFTRGLEILVSIV